LKIELVARAEPCLTQIHRVWIWQKKLRSCSGPAAARQKSHFRLRCPEVPQLRCRPAGLERSHGCFERSNSMAKSSKLRLFFFCDPDNLKNETFAKGKVCPKSGRTCVRPRRKLSLLFRKILQLSESLILQGFEKAVFGVAFSSAVRPVGKKKCQLEPQSKIILWSVQPRCALPRFRDFRASAIFGLVRFR
jgi:hypothetical protein